MKKLAFTLVAAGSVALFTNASTSEASTHVVQPGDSLWKISVIHNTSVQKIMELNNLNSTTIFPAQQLKVDGTNSPVQTTGKQPTSSQSSTSKQTTYTIKSGDTLSRIAANYGVSVSSIQKDNSISGHLIYPGQTLSIGGTASTPSTSTSNKTSSTSKPQVTTPATRGTYTVVSGDTLSAIAYRNGLSVTQLMNWNNLTSSLIRIGQKLKIENGIVEQTSNSNSNTSANTNTPNVSSNTVTNVINIAKSRLGDPYVWGGSSPGGFDCSGFIYYAYSKAGVSVPRTNAVGFDARSYTVYKPQVGDLVFFKNTYQSGISHLGIYIGNNSFLHAGGNKVQITSLSDPYWSKHFDSYKRFYAMD